DATLRAKDIGRGGFCTVRVWCEGFKDAALCLNRFTGLSSESQCQSGGGRARQEGENMNRFSKIRGWIPTLAEWWSRRSRKDDPDILPYKARRCIFFYTEI